MNTSENTRCDSKPRLNDSDCNSIGEMVSDLLSKVPHGTPRRNGDCEESDGHMTSSLPVPSQIESTSQDSCVDHPSMTGEHLLRVNLNGTEVCDLPVSSGDQVKLNDENIPSKDSMTSTHLVESRDYLPVGHCEETLAAQSSSSSISQDVNVLCSNTENNSKTVQTEKVDDKLEEEKEQKPEKVVKDSIEDRIGTDSFPMEAESSLSSEVEQKSSVEDSHLPSVDNVSTTTQELSQVNQKKSGRGRGRKPGLKSKSDTVKTEYIKVKESPEINHVSRKRKKEKANKKTDLLTNNCSKREAPPKKRRTLNSLSASDEDFSQLPQLKMISPVDVPDTKPKLEQENSVKDGKKDFDQEHEEVGSKHEIGSVMRTNSQTGNEVKVDASMLNSEGIKSETGKNHKTKTIMKKKLNKRIVAETDTENTNVTKPRRKVGRPPLVGNFQCKHCDYFTTEKRCFIRHQSSHKVPPKRCKYCDFETRSMQTITEHEAKHTKERPYKCKLCSYKCRYRADLYHHRAKHEVEKKYHCPHEGCSFVTKWRRNISHHLHRHNEARPHVCDMCGMSFKRPQDLKYHLYRHSDAKPIKCDQCDFRCKTNFEIKCHKLKHSDERNFACTFPGCTSRTKTKSDMTKHMKTHVEEKNYVCATCNKGFKTQSSLTKHQRRHSDERPYCCNICNKTFKFRAGLRNHLQLHTGFRPFSCDICGQTFSNKSNKIVHMKTHDYSNRPFRCALCPYAARVTAHLLAHIGIMHGNKYAYFCELCKKPFRRYGQLKVHHDRMHSKSDLLRAQDKLHIDIQDIRKEVKAELLDQGFMDSNSVNDRSSAILEKCHSDTREVDQTDDKPEINCGERGTEVNPGSGNVSLQSTTSGESNGSYNDQITKDEAESSSEIKVEIGEEIARRDTFHTGEWEGWRMEGTGEVNQNDKANVNDCGIRNVTDIENRIGDKKEGVVLPGEDDVRMRDAGKDENGTEITHDSQEQGSDIISSDINTKTKITDGRPTNQIPATLAIYDGLRLPLATHGFEFNFEKKGKKPKSWFMDPKNMDEQAREHHHKYLERKEKEQYKVRKRKYTRSKAPVVPQCSIQNEGSSTRLTASNTSNDDGRNAGRPQTWPGLPLSFSIIELSASYLQELEEIKKRPRGRPKKNVSVETNEQEIIQKNKSPPKKNVNVETIEQETGLKQRGRPKKIVNVETNELEMVKKQRGRPKKNISVETNEQEIIQKPKSPPKKNVNVETIEQEIGLKQRGRSKKIVNVETNEIEIVKKQRGRPKKKIGVETNEQEIIQKYTSPPKKNANVEIKESEIVKRHRGRPRKNICLKSIKEISSNEKNIGRRGKRPATIAKVNKQVTNEVTQKRQKEWSSSPRKVRVKKGAKYKEWMNTIGRGGNRGRKAAEEEFVIEWETREQADEPSVTEFDIHGNGQELQDIVVLPIKQEENQDCSYGELSEPHVQMESDSSTLNIQVKNEVNTYCDDIVVRQNTSSKLKSLQAIAESLISGCLDSSQSVLEDANNDKVSSDSAYSEMSVSNSEGHNDTSNVDTQQNILSRLYVSTELNQSANIETRAPYVSTEESQGDLPCSSSESSSGIVGVPVDVKSEQFDLLDESGVSPCVANTITVKQEPAMDKEFIQSLYGI